MKRHRTVRMVPVLVVCVALLAPNAMASTDSKTRRQLQRVAKGWCETIRASQVIPVYPLTEDLMPGDVFLVQTPVETQADLYAQKGFLSLDDHRTRLTDLNYKKMYFSGYWADEFGSTPHPRPSRTVAGPVVVQEPPGDGAAPTREDAPDDVEEPDAQPAPVDPADDAPGIPIALSNAMAPRAAFPSYSFSVRTSKGLGLALPIKAVPVGMSFLGTDYVTGSVTISDARTYAADSMELYAKLETWVGKPEVRIQLRAAVKLRKSRPVFLRVVSRVYLTGGVIVSITRGKTRGFGATAGNAPAVSLVDAQGNVNKQYADMLAELNKSTQPVTAIAEAGAQFKFLTASNMSVSMAESFDRLLVVGYLGFDVQVDENGNLGAIVPTFERLEGLAAPPEATVGLLTPPQSRFKIDETALKSVVKSNPEDALRIMCAMVKAFPVAEFKTARQALATASGEKVPSERVKKIGEAQVAFEDAAIEYVSRSGQSGERYSDFSEEFARAWAGLPGTPQSAQCDARKD